MKKKDFKEKLVAFNILKNKTDRDEKIYDLLKKRKEKFDN